MEKKFKPHMMYAKLVFAATEVTCCRLGIVPAIVTFDTT